MKTEVNVSPAAIAVSAAVSGISVLLVTFLGVHSANDRDAMVNQMPWVFMIFLGAGAITLSWKSVLRRHDAHSDKAAKLVRSFYILLFIGLAVWRVLTVV